MTWRGLLLGVLLGLFVSAFTYFNDQVVRQTFLIGNHLPAIVFGVGLVLLLVVNPALRALGWLVQGKGIEPQSTAGSGWGFSAGEIAVALALGLAVCAWPGSNLLRYFTHLMAWPVQQLPTKTSWVSTNAMSYIPGQSPLLAKGYVADWPELMGALRKAQQGDAEASPVVAALVERLEVPARRLIRDGGDVPNPSEQSALLRWINAAMGAGPLINAAQQATPRAQRLLGDKRLEALGQADVQRLNRVLLEEALPGVIKPQPEGEGVLLPLSARGTPAIDTLVSGSQTPLGLDDLPWDVWWPTLRLWGGGILLAALASLCLMVIVHPQWSQRELLPYPTVEFVNEVTRTAAGRWLPDIASNKAFWWGLGPVVVIHLFNGLHAYYPEFPTISLQFDFSGLRTLFPNAARAPGQDRLFLPTIFPSVIGFGFFITTRVSLSIGLSLVFWLVLGSWLLMGGQTLSNEASTVGANGTSLRFGAYLAMTLMIIYFGRRYYLQVVRAAVGLPRSEDTPAYAGWALRGAVVFSVLAMALLVRYAGMTPLMSVLFVLTFLMMLLVLARINVETGLFYAQPDWRPGVMLAGVFGVAGLGTEMLMVMLIASSVFAADPREGIAPYLANGLRLGDRVANVSPRRIAPWLGVMVVVSLLVAGGVTLLFQYNRGLNLTDWYAVNMPLLTIDHGANELQELESRDEIASATGLSTFDHFRLAKPDAAGMQAVVAGFALVILCAVARIRLPWWPIHPVLFLVWGTYPANYFAVSFLLAALVKVAVVRIGGVKSYASVKPVMVGFIAGDVLMILFWAVVGAVYWLVTGSTPQSYLILPI